ncbi:hypothetical protein [Polaribacter sp.]|uniref:hypothetical protein n=1 Tax=Polaribacter sp. TaxID=1920175 RepID=UPI003F6A16D3
MVLFFKFLLAKNNSVIFFVILNLFFISSCAYKNDFTFDDKILVKDSIYLVFRGTKTKQGFFARDFNIIDSLSSHIGIALYYKKRWRVFHISDYNDNFSDIRSHPTNVFFNIKKEKINYISLWGVKKLSATDVSRVKEDIIGYESKKVKFDKMFALDNKNKLYCSEFVNNVFTSLDSVKYKIPLTKRKLSGIYKQYFQKDTLIYYSVDSFHSNLQFYKIKEWYFE